MYIKSPRRPYTFQALRAPQKRENSPSSVKRKSHKSGTSRLLTHRPSTMHRCRANSEHLGQSSPSRPDAGLDLSHEREVKPARARAPHRNQSKRCDAPCVSLAPSLSPANSQTHSLSRSLSLSRTHSLTRSLSPPRTDFQSNRQPLHSRPGTPQNVRTFVTSFHRISGLGLALCFEWRSRPIGVFRVASKAQRVGGSVFRVASRAQRVGGTS